MTDTMNINSVKKYYAQTTMISGLPRKCYYRNALKDCHGFHHGQRKLLIGEIYFISQSFSNYQHTCGSDDKKFVVVYAGAAPGSHIKILANIFPFIEFHCYDPEEFSIQEHKNIHIYLELFTDTIAKQYNMKDKNVLFISDIRSTSRAEPNDEIVLANQKDQLRWCQIMQPYQAWLKFRIPFEQKEYKYLNGKVHFQPWAPLESTETRMLVDRKSSLNYKMMKEYPVTYHEEVCCYINTELRGKLDIKEYFHCYDCNLEKEMLDYCKNVMDNDENLSQTMAENFDKVLGERHSRKKRDEY